MKFFRVLIALIVLLVLSCQKDDISNEAAIQQLAGHWHVWDFEPSSDSPAVVSLLAKAAILKLVKEGCDPMEFTFKTDKKVSYKDGMRYLIAASNENGIQVNCADQYDYTDGTYDYNNNILTLNYGADTTAHEASLSDELLTIQVDDMLINGIVVSGKVIFKKE